MKRFVIFLDFFLLLFSDHFDCVNFDCDSQWCWRTHPCELCVNQWSWRTHPCELCVNHACEFRIKGVQIHPSTTETLHYLMPLLLSLDQLSVCRDLRLVKKKDKKRNVWLKETKTDTGDSNTQGGVQHGRYQDSTSKLENLSQHCTQEWQSKRPIL